MTNKQTRIVLHCTHERWFSPPIPDLTEKIYCPTCKTYENHGPVLGGGVSAKDDFSWTNNKRGSYVGKCLDDTCEHSEKSTSWYSLRDKMHKHYMREHTRFGAIEFTEIDRLPPGSPAPF